MQPTKAQIFTEGIKMGIAANIPPEYTQPVDPLVTTLQSRAFVNGIRAGISANQV